MNLEKIIPSNNYESRNGFSNEHLINTLTDEERVIIEDKLIEMLHTKNDMLVIETLAYMKSTKALPRLYSMFQDFESDSERIIISSAIFEIANDNSMVTVVIDCFKQLTNVYELIPMFQYLKKFNSPEIRRLIKSYVDHKDYLVSYNAKQALG